MKLLKRMAVLSLVVLALGGCTKSSISTDAPVSGSEEVDPAKMETDDDETLPRDQNFLVEDETVETTMYDWEQAQACAAENCWLYDGRIWMFKTVHSRSTKALRGRMGNWSSARQKRQIPSEQCCSQQIQ